MDQPAACRLPPSLPDDVVAEILARLAPRGVATARAVCKAWRAVVDGGRLLRADLLPLSVAGIFMNFEGHRFPEYFSRPSSSTGRRPNKISGQMDYLPSPTPDTYRVTSISGHCNGLLLVELDDQDYVVNPATRVWAPVPPPPPPPAPRGVRDIFHYRNYIAFDPTSSPYYEVISVPHIKYCYEIPPSMAEAQWPPPSCTLNIFSSRTSHWEERSFAREGETIATVLRMQESLELTYSAYLKGTLYVLAQRNSVMRISLIHNKYRAVKPPVDIEDNDKDLEFYIGKTEKWIYLALLDGYFLKVWALNESKDPIEWWIKHVVDIRHVVHRHCFQQASGPWVLQDINYNFYRHRYFPNDIKEAQIMEEQYDWDSDSDNVLGYDARVEMQQCGHVSILGFHPSKEVIFLSYLVKRGLAYHMNSSKVQDLGSLYPTEYKFFEEMCQDIVVSFPYTRCWT